MNKLLFIIVVFCTTLFSQNTSSVTVTINAVGDVLFDERLCSLDFNVFEEVRNLLQTNSPDITICNLEGPITEFNLPKKTKKFLFKMPYKSVEYIKFLGFNILTYANNHIMDFGETGLKNTQDILTKNNILHTGKKDEYVTTEVNGIKIFVIAFSWLYWTNNYLEITRSINLIKKAKQENNIVIISIHCGAEGEGAEVFPTDKDEIYLGENRGNIYKFARKAIDAGADLVLGHGPHVVRGMEIYKNKLIVYSLGNFIVPKMCLKNLKKYTLILSVKINNKGNFVSGQIIPCVIRTDWQYYGIPKYDNTKKVVGIIKQLSDNFKENKLKIDNDGNLYVLE